MNWCIGFPEADKGSSRIRLRARRTVGVARTARQGRSPLRYLSKGKIICYRRRHHEIRSWVMTATIRDIRLFVAAYEEHSFTAAATREGATQSGVSQHIGKLENLLGIRLFTRNKTGVTTTPAADAYYHRCIEILRMHEAAHGVLIDFAHGLDGQIVIGLMPSMTRCVLAPALATFIDLHPNVAVRIVEGYSGTLTRQVAAGELEFAIVPAFSETSGVRSLHFARIPEVLVSKKGVNGKDGQLVRLTELDALKLVVPGKDNIRRRLLDTYFTSNGVRVHRMMEFDAMLGTLAFVSHTDWQAILPAIMMADPGDSRLFDIRLICDPPLTLDLVLIEAARRPMSRGAEALLELVDAETRRLNGYWKTRKKRESVAPAPHTPSLSHLPSVSKQISAERS
jgi:LysR family nitrogen assimilation transcriptional regulator